MNTERFAVCRQVLATNIGGQYCTPQIGYVYVSQPHESLLHTTSGFTCLVPISVHATEGLARQECGRLIMRDCQMLNPFWCDRLFDSFGRHVDDFRAQLSELALWDERVPLGGSEIDEDAWIDWWDKHADSWSAEQRFGVWTSLLSVDLYVVMPIEFDDQ